MYNEGYKILREFECCGKHMIVVRMINGIHTMTINEWNYICKVNHFTGHYIKKCKGKIA